MQKTFLITGSPSKLTVDIAHDCLSRKQNVLLTLEPGMEAPAIPSGLEQNLQYIEWNRRSPISSRFVLLQAMNKQIEIDHAVVVYSPFGERTVLHEANAAFFEEKIDQEIKSVLFMVKELLGYFMKAKKGALSFVLQTGAEVVHPMDALVMEGLHGMVESMFAYYSQENIALRGFVAKNAQNRQIAEFVVQMLLDDLPKTRNKMHRYGSKLNLFGFGGK